MASNTQPCSACKKYWPLVKGLKKGKKKKLSHGYCLERTVFASNKPGNPVYPPRAKVKELPNGNHKVILVRKSDVKANCEAFVKR